MSSGTVFEDSTVYKTGNASHDKVSGILFGSEDHSATALASGISGLEGRGPTETSRPLERVLRRFDGVLLEMGGEDAKVALFEKRQKYEYWLPAGPLRKAGIEVRGQPFEMDECEAIGQGECRVSYCYRAAAEKKDAYREILDLDEDRKKKLEELCGWNPAQD